MKKSKALKWVLLGALVPFVLAVPMLSVAQPPKPATLRVGIIPVAAMLPLFAAQEKGFFAEAGLKVEMVPLAGGAAILEAMAGGSVDVGLANIVSLIFAAEQGFDFKILVNQNSEDTIRAPGATPPYKGCCALMVRKDSGIKSAKELEGKRIATATLNNIDWLVAQEWMRKNGADPAKATWVEVPFPQMGPALLKREVDAITQVEPFNSILIAGGEVGVVDYYFSAVKPDVIIASFVASDRWIKRNQDVAERFAKGIAKGVDYVNQRPEERVPILTKYTRLTAEVAAKMVLHKFEKEVNVDQIKWYADLMRERGLLKKPVDVNQLVFRP